MMLETQNGKSHLACHALLAIVPILCCSGLASAQSVENRVDSKVVCDIAVKDLTVSVPAQKQGEGKIHLFSPQNSGDWETLFKDGHASPSLVLGGFFIEDDVLKDSDNTENILFWKGNVRDFQTRITYRIRTKGEAKLFFRATNAPAGSLKGYSVGLSPEQGWLFNLRVPLRFDNTRYRFHKIRLLPSQPYVHSLPSGELQTLEVTGIGSSFSVKHNGKDIYTFSDKVHASGLIGILSRHEGIEILSMSFRHIVLSRSYEPGS